MERVCELLRTYPAHAEWAVARLVSSLGPKGAAHDFSDLARGGPHPPSTLAEVAIRAVHASGDRLDGADHAYRAMASLIAADLKRTSAARSSVLGALASGALRAETSVTDVVSVHEWKEEDEEDGDKEEEVDLEDPRHGARHTFHVDLVVSMGQHPHFLKPDRWAMVGRACLTAVFVPPVKCTGPVVVLGFRPEKCPTRLGRMHLINQLVHAVSAMHVNSYVHGALTCNTVYVCLEDVEARCNSLFIGPSTPSAAHRSVVVTSDLVSLSVLALCIWHWVEPRVLFPRIVQHENPPARGVPVYSLDAHRAGGGSDDTTIKADVELPVFVAQFYTLLRNAPSGFVAADSVALVAPAGRAMQLATATKPAPPTLCDLPSL